MDKAESILVCVTGQQSCARIIEAGAVIAAEQNRPLQVLSVFPSKSCYEPDLEALEELYQCAMKHGAQMSIYYNDYPFIVAASLAKKQNVKCIITGFSKTGVSPFITGLHSILPTVPISMVDEEGEMFHIIPNKIYQTI